MISDPWIDRTPRDLKSNGAPYRSSKAQRDRSKKRRDTLRTARRCTNGPARGRVGHQGIRHGTPAPGNTLCDRCLIKRKLSE